MKNEKIKKYIRIVAITAILSAGCIMFAGAVYSHKVFNDITDNVVRLHVIANSDNKEDQILKLKVRDAVVEYSKQSMQNCNSSDEAIRYLQENCDDIEAVAKECLRREGSNYDACVSVGTHKFPSKNYGKYCFPEGEYQALRVVIGEGVGKNWWCVLFPPLCYVSENAVSVSENAETALKNNISNEAFDTIDGEQKNNSSVSAPVNNSSGIDKNVKVTYKFKIVEFFQKIFSFFSD